MWEIFSFGEVPYKMMNTQEAIEYVLAGNRMAIPNECPAEVFEMMNICWQEEPTKRPSFAVTNWRYCLVLRLCI
jgi:receptor tyrosine kinase